MRKIKYKKVLVVSFILCVVLLFWIFIIGIYSNQPGQFYNKGHNAVWLGHEWVGEYKNKIKVYDLIRDLERRQIDTVFVHAGPFKDDGSIDPSTYQNAVGFIEYAKMANKEMSFQAWLGQVRSNVDLKDPSVRHNMAKQALILTEMVGFDGVHIDIEPVWDNDEDFLSLLKEIREVISKDKIISVALAEFIPGAFVFAAEKVHKFENFNSEVSYKGSAKYADQIVVMAYDTGINRGWLYKWLVEEQTIRLTNLLEGKEVFIGIPAYNDEKEGFNPKVENIENGLMGIINGLNNIRSEEENFAGVAIYPYWEIDENEWGVYEKLWLKNPQK
jgi:hypothetical protein